MHLLSILWRRRFKIIVVVLAFSISLLTVAPVIKGGLNGVFYSIDPDVVYTANALLFIKSGYISYFEHPGTPAIAMISLFLAPLRIYAKYVQHEPFINWVFHHYAITFYYLRISQALLLFVSLLMISIAVRIFTNKSILIVFLFLALLSFTPFYNLGTIISAETFTFFITSFWLILLSIFLKKCGLILASLISFIAGVSFAARATAFFLIPATLMIVLVSDGNLAKKIQITFLSLLLIALGFVCGIAPTRTHITTVLNVIFSFANSTGIHMSGTKTIFDLRYYLDSINSLVHTNILATFLVVISSLFAIYSLFRSNKIFRTISVVLLIFALGSLVFAKFPLPHYQITNYLVIGFCSAILFSKFPSKLIFSLSLVLLLLVIPISRKYLFTTSLSIGQTSSIEQFVKDNPPQHASVWNWAPSMEFAYLWNRDYADGMFDDELSSLQYKIYEFKPVESKIGISRYTDEEIFSICWDELYLRKQLLDKLIESYPYSSSVVEEVANTDLYLIRSSHCKFNQS